MHWSIYLLIVIGTFAFMEFVAWFTHKFVMHGFLWTLHKDHHNKTRGFFEKNDAFFLIFAVPSFLCFLFGWLEGYNYLFFIGLGILAYGIAYFFVHDIFIHQRFKLLRKAKHPYFQAIRYAHKMHHKHLGKGDGESFGMLFAPPKYFKQALKSAKKN